jgi:hypothetical protein
MHGRDKGKHGGVVAKCYCELETVDVRVQGSHDIRDEKIKRFIFWDDGRGKELVASCFGHYALFAEKRLPFGSEIFWDEAVKKCFYDAIVGMAEEFVPLHAFHGRFVGHGRDNELVGRSNGGSGCHKGPTVVGEEGAECAVLICEGHPAV